MTGLAILIWGVMAIAGLVCFMVLVFAFWEFFGLVDKVKALIATLGEIRVDLRELLRETQKARADAAERR